MSPTPTIAVVGGIIMDLVFEVSQMPQIGQSMDALSLTSLPGGKGSNAAVAAYRASRPRPNPSQTTVDTGFHVAINTSIGTDAFGQTLLSALETAGVDTSGVTAISAAPSGTCTVVVNRFTGESYNVGIEGANHFWTFDRARGIESLAGVAGTKPKLVIAHLELPAEQVANVLEAAHEGGVPTLLDPSCASELPAGVCRLVTHLVMNKGEAAVLAGLEARDLNHADGIALAAQKFIDLGVQNVVITLGEEGAYYHSRGADSGGPATGLVPASRVEHVKDTTGAGDAFVGAYAVSVVRQREERGWDIGVAVRTACRAAGMAIQCLGAQDGLPWADEIES